MLPKLRFSLNMRQKTGGLWRPQKKAENRDLVHSVDKRRVLLETRLQNRTPRPRPLTLFFEKFRPQPEQADQRTESCP